MLRAPLTCSWLRSAGPVFGKLSICTSLAEGESAEGESAGWWELVQSSLAIRSNVTSSGTSSSSSSEDTSESYETSFHLACFSSFTCLLSLLAVSVDMTKRSKSVRSAEVAYLRGSEGPGSPC